MYMVVYFVGKNEKVCGVDNFVGVCQIGGECNNLFVFDVDVVNECVICCYYCFIVDYCIEVYQFIFCLFVFNWFLLSLFWW